MKTVKSEENEAFEALTIKVEEGLAVAYEKLLEFKRQKGTDLVIMQEGKIVKDKVT